MKTMRLKEWVIEESQRCGVGMEAIYMRLNRGKYSSLRFQRMSKRTIIVLNPNQCFSPKFERCHVQDVKQEGGEVWLRISATNAKRGTPPTMCVMPGDTLIIQQNSSAAKAKSVAGLDTVELSVRGCRRVARAGINSKLSNTIHFK
jgi:hypothetical protein